MARPLKSQPQWPDFPVDAILTTGSIDYQSAHDYSIKIHLKLKDKSQPVNDDN